ncbi:hypothetical protein [Methyloferula stellata]|uniref:hypothetical protein n=1 Tax=Methyloferula stellata TaxID=876270 RepID=UPI0006880C31|nr:hypothetical protein [Methyloferula stellata]
MRQNKDSDVAAIMRPNHDDFGLNQSKIIVIDPKGIERDAGGKPLHTFPHPALDEQKANHLSNVGLQRGPVEAG